MTETIRQRVFNKIIEKNGLNEKERPIFSNIYNKVSAALWVITKFMVTIYILNKTFYTIGFEKTLILELAIVGILLQMTLRRGVLSVK